MSQWTSINFEYHLMIHEKHGTADPIKFCKLTYFDTLNPSAPCSMPNTPRGPLFGANVKRLGIPVHSTYFGLGALSAYLGKGKSVTCAALFTWYLFIKLIPSANLSTLTQP
jgi:hypothetical protein